MGSIIQRKFTKGKEERKTHTEWGIIYIHVYVKQWHVILHWIGQSSFLHHALENDAPDQATREL